VTRSPLERYAGTLAVTSADLGARLALVAVAEMLYEAGMNEAAELVNDHGDVAVARAFSEASWNEETTSNTRQGPEGKTARGDSDGMG
jgi:hypothetical protein